MLRRAERELNELLVSTYDNIGRVEDSMLASHKTDLTIAELHGLEVVGRSPDGQASITSIAQTLGLTLPTVTVAVPAARPVKVTVVLAGTAGVVVGVL